MPQVPRERVDALSLRIIQGLDGLGVEECTLALLLTLARIYTGRNIGPDEGMAFVRNGYDWTMAYFATDGRES